MPTVLLPYYFQEPEAPAPISGEFFSLESEEAPAPHHRKVRLPGSKLGPVAGYRLGNCSVVKHVTDLGAVV